MSKQLLTVICHHGPYLLIVVAGLALGVNIWATVIVAAVTGLTVGHLTRNI